MHAIQDLIPNNKCFGCGPLNPNGLHIKSVWSDNEHNQSECFYKPMNHQCAGPSHVVNGGVISTVIDCHCVCTAIGKGYLMKGRLIGEGEPIWFATGQIAVSFRKPAFIQYELILKAKITEAKEKKITLSCDVWSNSECVAVAEVVAVKVPNAWFSGE